MRGENNSPKDFYYAPIGSSPHARGKLQFNKRLNQTLRLIPACAGKTTAATSPSGGGSAHPRMRGENFFGDEFRFNESGSSPHARGKPSSRLIGFPPCGLIPACAGKTGYRRTRGRPCGAHPRMRGENTHRQKLVRIIRGSSPHARGKPERGGDSTAAWGLIPACAGKTLFRFSGCLIRWAHPRMRG